jgi:hypothetical protein
MSTLTIILVMVAVAALLLLGAVIADRRLQRRVAQRRALEDNPEAAAQKRDAADALIDMLNRSGEVVRQTLRSARDEDKK